MDIKENRTSASLTKIFLILMGFIVLLSVLVFFTIYILPSTNILKLENKIEGTFVKK
jgi:hypothetical protein